MQFLTSKISAFFAVLSMAALTVVASPVHPGLAFDRHQTPSESAEWNILDRRSKHATSCDFKVVIDGKVGGSTYVAPVVQEAMDRWIELEEKKQSVGYDLEPILAQPLVVDHVKYL
ncbi:hypothetical protein EYR38_009814 [Pleurotus pulmonarius]|nr:hypothetical protein EYR38_009814 [Pleurotus pulmonarius]